MIELSNNRQQLGKLLPTPFISVDEQQLAQFANISFLFPNVSIAYSTERYYPYNEYAAHALGHISYANEDDLLDADLFDHPNDAKNYQFIGKNGIERAYDKVLRGHPGSSIMEINALGHRVRTLKINPRQDGEDIFLNVDIELQQRVDELMRNRRGAAVVMNPFNGQIYAITSAPFFDNNLRIKPSLSEFREFINNPQKPLLNRFAQGTYPPASVFKPFIALAGLHLLNFDAEAIIDSKDFFQIDGDERKFYDWKRGGHGPINFYQAMAVSSDYFFYNLAYQMGIDDMYEYLNQFPFGKPTGIDLMGEFSGRLPSSEWKNQRFGEQWTAGDNVNFGIGQGYLQVTPLQLNTAMAMIANNGHHITPQLTQGHPHYFANNQLPRFKPELNSIVQKSLQRVVSYPRGTAFAVFADFIPSVAGKTGTAQLFSLSQDIEERESEQENIQEHLRDHALFSAYAPVDNPQVVVTVVIENGGSASRSAAPIAKQILSSYFEIFSTQLGQLDNNSSR